MATAQRQPPQTTTREQAIIAAVSAALVAGATIAATRRAIRLALAPLRLNVKAVDAAFELARRVPHAYRPPRRPRAPRAPQGRVVTLPGGRGEVPTPQAPATPAAAVTATRDSLMDHRAAYLLNAAERIDETIAERPETETAEEALTRALGKERRWFAAHRRMQDRRLASARAVDIAAAIYGTRLGWWAIPDNQPASEACQRAHGKDFIAGQPPHVGRGRAYPGAVHPYCACRPGPPFHTSLLP